MKQKWVCFLTVAATKFLAWPLIRGCIITTWIAWVDNVLIAYNSWKGYWKFSTLYFTCFIMPGTLSQVGILGVDLLQFLPYNFVCTEASIEYEQIVNTGPHSALNFILTVIHSGVHGQCLRLCSRVFPLDVLPQFYFKRWIWLPLMVS